MDLTGQVVLITGGSRGLGRAFAQALLAAGARVAIIDILAAELHEAAAQLSSAANQVVAIRADVTDPQAAPQVVTTVEERLGPLTLLINNAGQFRAFGPIGVVAPSRGDLHVPASPSQRASAEQLYRPPCNLGPAGLVLWQCGRVADAKQRSAEVAFAALKPPEFP